MMFSKEIRTTPFKDRDIQRFTFKKINALYGKASLDKVLLLFMHPLKKEGHMSVGHYVDLAVGLPDLVQLIT